MIDFLQKKADALHRSGVNDVIIDPGFGFAKTMEQNYEMMQHLDVFSVLNMPLLVGVSRKSMIYNLLGTLKSARVEKFIAGDVRKRWQLAQRMAELFDSYMTCRQEMLEQWKISHPDRDWQKQLWEDLSRDRTDSFAALCRRFLSLESFKPGNRRYFFFAVAALPAVHLDCILKLAETTEVHFFMFNPCLF